MDEFFAFIAFFVWFLKFIGFFWGLLTGSVLTLAFIPWGWRQARRAVLRRNWRRDRPGRVAPGLTPEWQDYEPEIPGIHKRCICHNRRLYPGERVLTWPETGPMNLFHVPVYCESVRGRLMPKEMAHAEDA